MNKKIVQFLTGVGVLANVVLGSVGTAISEESSSQSTTSPQQMEIIWSESDGENHAIYTSSYRAGSWAEPTKLTNDTSTNLHPSIDVDQKQQKWAAWTAIDGKNFTIKVSSAVGDQWQEPKELPSSLQTNIKPSIAVDPSNTPWIVWTGNNGGNDDIYFARYLDNGWTEAKRLHEPNAVPDILPFLTINRSGNPEVTWDSFQGQQYVRLKSTWKGTSWGDPVQVAGAESTQQTEQTSTQATSAEQQVTIPKFIKDTRQIYLRAYTPTTNQQ
ncbi:MAG: hypothetical protein D6B25_19820 [Desulfobulbaceae bacterium]|nr:MAG: hypothetical protein D6B25_19820 [Desulfobulbaceae bacterium]